VEALDSLRMALIELDEEPTLELTRKLLAGSEATPLSIVNTCQQALKVVGERYERQEYYLSGLIMAGELFKEVLDLVQPYQDQTPREKLSGSVVLGTVAGDIHDIGKNMFATSLKGFGFEVIDLGVDVPPERFLVELRRSRANVVCLSGLIMAAFDSMKETVRLLRAHEDEIGHRTPIVLGGATMDGRICQYCGADSWSTDAMEGVRICQGLVPVHDEQPLVSASAPTSPSLAHRPQDVASLRNLADD
jgi:methanogenic corrinoid protein MtbC1